MFEQLENRLVMDTGYIYMWYYMDPMGTGPNTTFHESLQPIIEEYGTDVSVAAGVAGAAYAAAEGEWVGDEAAAFGLYTSDEAAAKATLSTAMTTAVNNWTTAATAAMTAFETGSALRGQALATTLTSLSDTFKSAVNSAAATFDQAVSCAASALAAAQAAYDADPEDPDKLSALQAAQSDWNAAVASANPAYISAVNEAGGGYDYDADEAIDAAQDDLDGLQAAFDTAINGAIANFNTAKSDAVAAYNSSEALAWSAYLSSKAAEQVDFGSDIQAAISAFNIAEADAEGEAENDIDALETAWATSEAGIWDNYIAAFNDPAFHDPENPETLGQRSQGPPPVGTNFAEQPPPPPNLPGTPTRQRGTIPLLAGLPSGAIGYEIRNPRLYGHLDFVRQGANINPTPNEIYGALNAGAVLAGPAGIAVASGNLIVEAPEGYHTVGTYLESTLSSVPITAPLVDRL